MTDIFRNESEWFAFVDEHNRKVDPAATPLNGSKSITLAAIYLAAGKEIPLDVRLADKTIRKKGVADHFKWLRQYYETGRVDKKHGWTITIVEECREFANENSLDSDELIQRIIELTERGGGGTALSKTSKQSLNYTYLPTKEDVESAYRMLSRPGESISIDAVLDQLEIHAGEKGYTLKSNWRMITEENMKIWSKNG